MFGWMLIWNGKGKSKDSVGEEKAKWVEVILEEIYNLREIRVEIWGVFDILNWKYGGR